MGSAGNVFQRHFVIDFFCLLDGKTFLNVFRQLDKINFRDPRLGFNHDSIRLYPADLDVFVFFPVNRFEVLGQCR